MNFSGRLVEFRSRRSSLSRRPGQTSPAKNLFRRRDDMPQYLLAGYLPDNYDPSTADEGMAEAIYVLNREMIAAGVRKFACGLGPAQTLRVQPDGEVVITD